MFYPRSIQVTQLFQKLISDQLFKKVIPFNQRKMCPSAWHLVKVWLRSYKWIVGDVIKKHAKEQSRQFWHKSIVGMPILGDLCFDIQLFCSVEWQLCRYPLYISLLNFCTKKKKQSKASFWKEEIYFTLWPSPHIIYMYNWNEYHKIIMIVVHTYVTFTVCYALF